MSTSNSVLFDIDSIVDIEATAMHYVLSEWPHVASGNTLPNDTDIKIKRMYGPGLFYSIINPEYSNSNLMNDVLKRDQKEIFESDYVHLTDISVLLSAYKKTGGGIIKTAIRCDNEFQKKFISNKLDSDVQFIVQDRKDVDTTKFGRIFVGNCINALEYEFENPKSIVVLNFIENFSKDQLLSEFVLAFGDIHSIQIANAYILDIEG